ncbi:hypothetical protein [Microbacterium sp. OR16]|uniref:hypothetical protein n=1 Tax=Microbacterium sp. OR16 TaxID=3095345 RepID=UPI0039B3B8E9
MHANRKSLPFAIVTSVSGSPSEPNTSHFTVLRGALVGASQAVWILEPEDRNVRRERGLTVLTVMYAQTDKYYGFLESTPLDAADRASLVDQRRWLTERRGDA